jgi:hypothetical protein
MSQAFAGRPDAAFSFKENSCVCRDDKPVSRGDCVNVCRGKNTKGADVLFAEFDVTTVLSNSSLKHVKNWCYKYLLGDSQFPKCVFEATDSFGNKSIIPTFSFPKNNSLTVDVSALADDMNYTFRLVETTSKTASFPYDVYIFDPVGIPLKQASLAQYTCIPRSAAEVKLHYFYSLPWAPETVRADSKVVCHDVVKYGETDKPGIPRLENAPAISKLWNQTNYLFSDNNADGVLDVNELFMKKVQEYGGSTKGNIRLFGNLTTPGSKEENYEAGNMAYAHPGFVMSYWVDNAKFLSYCPTAARMNSRRADFKAFKDIVGTDTEGLYVADRSESELRDHLLVRESDLKAVWFYMKNGVATKPTDEIIPFQAIYFHYPFNKESPYVKGPNQKIYRLRSVQEAGLQLTTLQAFIGETGEMITYPAHDKKFACVPKL